MDLPIVKAASTVPIPSPFICPKNTNVSIAVVKRQVTSNVIFILAYGIFIISDNSLGNKSVGIIGSPHLFDKAIPNANIK